MRARRRLLPGVADTFDILTPDAARSFVASLTGRVSAAAFPLSAMALFASIVVVTNTTLVSVTQRTREIGVRRALGATRGDILRQFLLESAIVSGLGGVLGVLGGVLLVVLASKGLSAWLGSWPAHYKLWAMGLGLGSSALTGVVFGLYPAWRAARLDPVEALRYE